MIPDNQKPSPEEALDSFRRLLAHQNWSQEWVDRLEVLVESIRSSDAQIAALKEQVHRLPKLDRIFLAAQSWYGTVREHLRYNSLGECVDFGGMKPEGIELVKALDVYHVWKALAANPESEERRAEGALRPCPICEGKAHHVNQTRYVSGSVFCVDCGCMANYKDWNRRSSDAQIAALKDELSNAVNMMSEKWPTSFGKLRWACGHEGPGKCAAHWDELAARAEKAEAEVAALKVERDAYKKAKQENDDRFMNERDSARSEVAALKAEINTLKTDGGIWDKAVYKDRAERARAEVAALKEKVKRLREALVKVPPLVAGAVTHGPTKGVSIQDAYQLGYASAVMNVQNQNKKSLAAIPESEDKA